METLYKRFREAGLEFLAVDIREKQEQVETFIREYSLSFPVALDQSGRVSSAYGVRGIPTTFIVDRDSTIIAMSVGGKNWNSPAVIAAFEALLNDEP
jgi:peroxiredoxin